MSENRTHILLLPHAMAVHTRFILDSRVRIAENHTFPGWKSTAVHWCSPMFHRSPTGGPLRWHPQILRWPPVDNCGGPPVEVLTVPPVVTDCSTDGTRMTQVQQKLAEINRIIGQKLKRRKFHGNHWIQIYS